METNEDEVVETTPEVEEVITEEAVILEETTPEEPETTPEVVEEETEPVVENIEDPEVELENEDDLSLIDDLLKESEKEEEPTEPKFFPESEKESEEFIDEELLNDLDAWFEELESELATAKETITENSKALEESQSTASAYSEALDKLGEHPILWPLNEKLLKGEEVNIPEYLTKSLEEDIEALPNMDAVAHENTWIVTEETLQDKLEKSARNRY